MSPFITQTFHSILLVQIFIANTMSKSDSPEMYLVITYQNVFFCSKISLTLKPARDGVSPHSANVKNGHVVGYLPEKLTNGQVADRGVIPLK